MPSDGETVAVTGANGYLASWLVKVLLERGYTVRGVVRDPDDQVKVGHLWDLPGAKERLTLFKAHLLEEGGYDKPFDGVTGVFHTAARALTTKLCIDHENEMILPAVNGTLNVLRSAAKSKTVRRFVLTSSMGSVSVSRATAKPAHDNVVVDDTWWSDEEWCKTNELWYPLAKLRAERAAWDFMKNNKLHFDMVALCPTVSVGRLLQTVLNSSNELIRDFCTGFPSQWNANRTLGFVNITDVVKAHVLVFENPKAEGRYVLVERSIHGARFAAYLKIFYPRTPTYAVDEDRRQVTFRGDRIKEIGLEYTSADEGLKDCIDSLIEKKFLA